MHFHNPFRSHDEGGSHGAPQPPPQPAQQHAPYPQPPGMGCKKPSGPDDGDIIGQVVAGYQGWFTCEGDGSPLKGYWHWAPDRLKPMCASNCAVISWPDMRYYERQHATGFAAYPNGTPARLFSNMDAQTVYAHFRMMQDAEIRAAALQRFVPCGPEGPPRDITTVHVHNAALATGVKWYCMYDVGGWKKMGSELPEDWRCKMSQYAASPAYARQNGKPVVAIWGFGFNDDNHYLSPEECIQVIRGLQAAGVYVIGGVPTWWRKGMSDSRGNYAAVYRSFDCLSPWMVGRASETKDLDFYFNECNKGDAEELHALGIDYQPCVMPGDLATGRRLHGDFYWHHFANLARLGRTGVGLYVSMFDEYNEGHHIAPTAETRADQPADFAHPALDEDGVPCTADYYLRLTRDGGAMFRGRLLYSELRPTEPWPGRGPCHRPRAVAIKAMVNGRYVCAERDGRLINDRERAGPWETWTLEHAPGGVHLKAYTGKYMCAEHEVIVANRDTAGPWETFTVTRLDDGRVTIRAWTGKYVQAIPEGTGRMVAGADEAGWWESFAFEDV
ncbi:hypothetical protein CC85DRAFT_300652 [Cutaneotrichosporon oleaginosum]|uniref:Fascin-like domain-containing protein n=1 Tax=Cutaneotrichosporon oleaginosum TaxID=879819 RepID=A0A0J0XT21_9TREE|nr:uncharacterized protein CC85DRAFT_300652 [Cutaneotrichosporon oleaginosum]KLT44221.1 hypothetical protein CC85DRAFT_300652 [Cutaneotrichosporon oleaginosum]TXT11611.1 hypothetical protein COLE_02021 [Cutaneotrichosporon oleaginosum]